MSKFIFVRHGESEANLANRIGKIDTRLTEKGREQARETGRMLNGKNIKTIVCSDYLRAQQTAEIIAGELSIDIKDVKIIKDLGERRMGKYEGTLKDHEPEWYYMAEGPEFEPRRALFERAQQALDDIKKLCKDGLVVVVGHACSGFYLLQAAQGINDVEDFKPAKQMINAGYIEVEI